MKELYDKQFKATVGRKEKNNKKNKKQWDI